MRLDIGMSKTTGRTIAVLGAGPGLGGAVARRFGTEGYSVALMARRPEQLRQMAEELRAQGITASAFPVNLTDLDAMRAALAGAEQQLGPIDVLYLGATSDAPHTPPSQVEAADVARAAILNTWAPIEAVRAVLPGMRERGRGTILRANAASAIAAPPAMSGAVAPALAATRNWLQSLHDEVAADGVYVGALFVAAMIEGSAAWEQVRRMPGAESFPRVRAEDLADRLWDMASARDVFEAVLPAPRA